MRPGPGPDGRIEAAAGSAVCERRELDGGEVGRVYRVDLADGRTVVAKFGETSLSVEGAMLRYLARETALPVPAVYHASDDLLLIEFVPGDGGITPSVERDVAERLAALHGTTADAFGFPFDTLSGPLVQPNPWTGSWIEFFREHRLERAAGIAVDSGALPRETYGRVMALAGDLDDLLAEPDTPSLIHGDVWRENLVVRDGGVAAFLDPAIYYGHAEVDLAYALWTDTVGDPFLDRYRTLRGIDGSFRERRYDVYALPPLLEHVWFFGGSYLDEVGDRIGSLGY